MARARVLERKCGAGGARARLGGAGGQAAVAAAGLARRQPLGAPRRTACSRVRARSTILRRASSCTCRTRCAWWGPVAALALIDPWVGAAALIGLAAISGSIMGFDRAMIRLAAQENDAERRYASALIDAMGNVTSVAALRQGPWRGGARGGAPSGGVRPREARHRGERVEVVCGGCAEPGPELRPAGLVRPGAPRAGWGGAGAGGGPDAAVADAGAGAGVHGVGVRAAGGGA